MTGRVSPLAKKELAAREWSVVEGLPSSMEVRQESAAGAPGKKEP
jgi:hypothetical protein